MPGTPRMIIKLTKLGRNCQVVFNNSNGNTQTFQEDSANIECNYNQINDFVTVAIKGKTTETTSSIVFDNVLYINTGSGDVLIKTYEDFLINYSLLFLNSGGGSGGLLTADNGLTANSTNVQLGGTLIADTTINGNNQNFAIVDTIQVLLSAQQKYLRISSNNISLADFNEFVGVQYFGNEFVKIGGLENQTGLPSIWLDLQNYNIKLVALNTGLFADGISGVTTIGDTTSQGNATNIQIFDQSAIIQSICFGAANGLYVNFANGNHYFGDYLGNISQSYLQIDASTSSSLLVCTTISLTGNGGSGFFMDASTSRTIIGDYANIGNNSFLNIDDSEGKITLNTANGLVNIANIQAYADNAAALAAGLVVGDLYRGNGLGFDDFLHIVH